MATRVGCMARFVRYNLVGLLGLGVKLTLLAILVELAGIGHLAATAIAVEITILHNFTWHLRWTWRDRSAGLDINGVLARLLRFHMANGLVGMTANLVVMKLLVDGAGLHYLAANLAATAAAGMANYLLASLVVFVPVRACGVSTASVPSR